MFVIPWTTSPARYHRARADLGDLARTLDDARAGRDDHEFFFGMPVRRMRRRAGIEHAHACHHPAQLIGRAVEVREHPAPGDGIAGREHLEIDDAVGQLRSRRVALTTLGLYSAIEGNRLLVPSPVKSTRPTWRSTECLAGPAAGAALHERRPHTRRAC